MLCARPHPMPGWSGSIWRDPCRRLRLRPASRCGPRTWFRLTISYLRSSGSTHSTYATPFLCAYAIFTTVPEYLTPTMHRVTYVLLCILSGATHNDRSLAAPSYTTFQRLWTRKTRPARSTSLGDQLNAFEAVAVDDVRALASWAVFLVRPTKCPSGYAILHCVCGRIYPPSRLVDQLWTRRVLPPG